MVDAFAGLQAGDDLLLLGPQFIGNDAEDGLTDHLLGGVAENPRGAGIPGGDDAVEALADNRVVGGRHDRGEAGAVDFGLPPVGGVDQQIDCAGYLPLLVAQQRWVGEEREAGAVRTLADRLQSREIPALPQGKGQGAPVMRQR